MSSYRHGHIVWREIMTNDTDASLRFYGELFGWTHDVNEMPDGTKYFMLSAGKNAVGGCMKLPTTDAPPHWLVSISVADVDATAAAAKKAGGTVYVEPMDAGGFGRFAMIADPQGAVFNAWHSTNGDGERAPDYRPGVGEFCWEQLNTTNPKAAGEFYRTVIGWAEKPFSGGGGMDVFEQDGVQIASRMSAQPGVPAHWLTYVVVDALQSANDRVRKQGGKVLMDKIEIPTVGSISVIQDNVGAVLGLFEVPKG